LSQRWKGDNDEPCLFRVPEDPEESFSLVFVCFNTFFGLTTQREQIDCFN
jgi:hypothetical protein